MIKFNHYLLVAAILFVFVLSAGCNATANDAVKPEPVESQPSSVTEQPAAQNPAAATEQPVEQPTAAVQETQAASPALDGKGLAQERCTACHSFTRIENAKKSPQEWAATVQRMVGKGAKLSADEETAVVDYLSATYK